MEVSFVGSFKVTFLTGEALGEDFFFSTTGSVLEISGFFSWRSVSAFLAPIKSSNGAKKAETDLQEKKPEIPKTPIGCSFGGSSLVPSSITEKRIKTFSSMEGYFFYFMKTRLCLCAPISIIVVCTWFILPCVQMD